MQLGDLPANQFLQFIPRGFGKSFGFLCNDELALT